MYPTNNGTVTPKNQQESDFLDECRHNIAACYVRATESDTQAGLHWYRYAQAFVDEIAQDTGLLPDQVAAIVAVTSNNVKWKDQITGTVPLIRHILDGKDPRTAPGRFIGVCKEKAGAIIRGDYSALSGPKVVPFYHNIMGRYHLVTLDRHAVRIALNKNLTIDETGPYTKPGRRRNLIEAAYHIVAKMYNVDVAILQAITWCVWRETGD